MKALKVIERKYYSYDWENWKQPVISSNGTMGESDFACEASRGTAYYAFDGGTNTWDTVTVDNPVGGPPQWISWYSKVPIKISQLSFVVPSEPYYYYITDATVQGSNDNSNWVDLASIGNCYNLSTVTVSVNSQTAYNYHRIYVSNAVWWGGYYRVFFRTLTITAQCKTKVVAGTLESHDFYRDENIYRYFLEIKRKYYKTVENITQFSQPTLSSNGTVGGNSFAVTYTGGIANDGQPWKAFDGNQSTWWLSNNNSPATLTFYNPLPLNVTNIYITVGWPNDYAYVKAGIVKGSNDGSNWTDIVSWSGGTDYYNIVMSSNKSYYKYHQLYCTASSYVSHMSIGECKITATQKGSITNESTIEDYTYYKDFYIYKAFNC